MKFLKIIVIGVVCSFVLLVVIGVFVMKPESVRQGRTAPTTSNVSGYNLKPKEAALLEYLLKDEATVFSRGGDAIYAGDMVSVSASDVAKAYYDNQVTADQKYLKKTLRLTGIVESTDGRIYGEWYVSMFSPPLTSSLVRFQKEYFEKIQTLQKGEKLVLICDGAGDAVGSPEYDNCQFAGDYAIQKLPDVRKQINNFLSGEEPKSKNLAKFAVVAIAWARSLPDNSSCFSSGEQCSADLDVMQKEGASNTNFASVVQELKSDGVKMPPTKIAKSGDVQVQSKENAKSGDVAGGTVAVAETIAHGHIVLSREPCVGIAGGQFEMYDAFGKNVGGGCWVSGSGEKVARPGDDMLITGIEVNTMQRLRWNRDDFKLPAGKSWTN